MAPKHCHKQALVTEMDCLTPCLRKQLPHIEYNCLVHAYKKKLSYTNYDCFLFLLFDMNLQLEIFAYQKKTLL